MNDLISRQAALYSYQEVCNKVKCSECKATNEDGDCKLERWIKELPSAERRGQWKQVGDDAYRCSACGEISCCNSPFCSECGAKMEGEEE